jgi:hypothetical protein
VIFSNATGSPFSYAAFGGWNPVAILEFGRGYMVHYGDFIGGNNLISGVRTREVRDVRVNKGWNALGASSFTSCVLYDIVFNGIGGGPTPNRISEVFDFTATKGYNTVAYMDPGVGYFLRVDQEGFFNIIPAGTECKVSATSDADFKQALVKMTVRDAAQNGQELYFGGMMKANDARFELPPIARDFDARFVSNNGYIATSNEETINLRSDNYPVAMTFENASGKVEVRDETGNLIGTAENNGTVVIRNENVKKVVVSYKQGTDASVSGFALEANYPNPLSNATNFSYSVPAETFVTITLANSLGQQIETIVSSTVGAGTHEVNFDAKNLANGTYFYTMHAGNFSKTVKMTVQK